jgi:hypothetical protein
MQVIIHPTNAALQQPGSLNRRASVTHFASCVADRDVFRRTLRSTIAFAAELEVI